MSSYYYYDYKSLHQRLSEHTELIDFSDTLIKIIKTCTSLLTSKTVSSMITTHKCRTSMEIILSHSLREALEVIKQSSDLTRIGYKSTEVTKHIENVETLLF